MDSKPFYLSKTFWLGVLVAVVPFLEQVQELLASEVGGIAVTIVGVLIVILRFITKEPVSLSGGGSA